MMHCRAFASPKGAGSSWPFLCFGPADGSSPVNDKDGIRVETTHMTDHHLHSSPQTCHWGFFEAKLKPVLTIESGDEVTIETISGGPEVVPDRSRFHIPPELADVHAKNE